MILLLNMLVLLLTFGTVSIIDYEIYNIDNIAYEDLTYRDIFEQNNLTDIKQMVAYGYSNRVVISDNEISMDVDLISENSAFRFLDLSQFYQSHFYYSIEIKPKYNNRINIDLYKDGNQLFKNDYEYILSPIPNKYNRISAQYNWVTETPDDYNPRFEHSTFTQYSIGDTVYLRNYFIIDLSIFDVDPTKEEMDIMLEYYLKYQEESDFTYTFKDLSFTEFGTIFLFLVFDFAVIYVIRKGLF